MNKTEKQTFVENLHNRNELFLNKALFIVSGVTSGYIVYIFNNVGYQGWWTLGLIFSLLCFAISTCTLLWSFFESGKLINALADSDRAKVKRCQSRVEWENLAAFVLVVFGMVLVLILGIGQFINFNLK